VRKLISGLAAGVATAVLAASACLAQEVTLRFHHFLGSTSLQQVKFIEPWCEKIKSDSNGRMVCQIYPSMQLGGAPAELIDQARDGIADVVFANPGYASGKYLLSEMFELPFMMTDIDDASHAMWDLMQTYGEKEYPGIKIIAISPADYTMIQLANKRVLTMEDMQGLKIRTSSRYAAKSMEALGALPVQLPGNQITESLTRGVIDAGLLPWSAVRLLNLGEILQHYTDFAENQVKLTSSTQLIGMSQATYDSLPDDLKKVIDDNSGVGPSLDFATMYINAMNEDREIVKASGIEIDVLSDEEYNRWVEATAGVYDEWIQEATAKGYDAKAVLEEAKALIAKYSK